MVTVRPVQLLAASSVPATVAQPVSLLATKLLSPTCTVGSCPATSMKPVPVRVTVAAPSVLHTRSGSTLASAGAGTIAEVTASVEWQAAGMGLVTTSAGAPGMSACLGMVACAVVHSDAGVGPGSG